MDVSEYHGDNDDEDVEDEDYDNNDDDVDDNKDNDDADVVVDGIPGNDLKLDSNTPQHGHSTALVHVVMNHNVQHKNVIDITSHLALHYDPPLGPFSE